VADDDGGTEDLGGDDGLGRELVEPVVGGKLAMAGTSSRMSRTTIRSGRE